MTAANVAARKAPGNLQRMAQWRRHLSAPSESHLHVARYALFLTSAIPNANYGMVGRMRRTLPICAAGSQCRQEMDWCRQLQNGMLGRACMHRRNGGYQTCKRWARDANSSQRALRSQLSACRLPDPCTRQPNGVNWIRWPTPGGVAGNGTNLWLSNCCLIF